MTMNTTLDVKSALVKSKSYVSRNTIEILLGFLFASAFILSFDSLNAFARQNGITTKILGFIPLSMLWPLTLDAMIIASSLVEYVGAKRGYGMEFTRQASRWVKVFTGMSVFFNVLEGVQIQAENIFQSVAYISQGGNFISQDGLIGVSGALFGSILVRIIPPIGMYISFEKLLMNHVHHEMRKSQVIMTIEDLQARHDEMKSAIGAESKSLIEERQKSLDKLDQRISDGKESLDELLASIDKAQSTISGLNAVIDSKRAELKELKKGAPKSVKPQSGVRGKKKAERLQQIRKLFIEGETKFSRIASLINSTPKTVKAELQELGLVDDKGNPIEPGASDVVIERTSTSNGNSNGTQS